MGAFSSLANVGLNAAMSRSQTGRQNAAIKAEAERDIAEVRQRDAAARTERERELRERLAQARARAASAGTGSAGGSAAAVRRGIAEELLAEDALAVQARDLAIRNIRARAGDKRRRNLLESRSSMTKGLVGGAMKVGNSLLDL